MANSERLISWLGDHSSRLDLQLITHEWPKIWDIPELFDIEIQIKLAGEKFSGRGTDFGFNSSVVKAGAEAIERAVCQWHHISSTGVAVHTNAQSAIENAVNEFLERELFFCHFLTNTPFRPTSFSNHFMNAFKGPFNQLSLRNINMSVWMSFEDNLILCVADGRSAISPFGAIIGLGYHSDTEYACRRALFRMPKNVAAYCLGHERPKSLTQLEFNSINNPTPFDHQALALNKDYWTKMSRFFVQSNLNPSVTPMESPSKVEQLDCGYESLKEAPVFVYRASRTARSGIINHDLPITKETLIHFLGYEPSKSNLNYDPHFLG